MLRSLTPYYLLVICWLGTCRSLGRVYHNTLEDANAAERHIYLLRAAIDRATEASRWKSTDMHTYHPEDRPFKQRKNSGISETEVTGATILLKRLLDLRHQFNMGTVVLGESLDRGRQCSGPEVERQEEYVRLERPPLCAEVQAYKLAQLAWPEAAVIVDIGSDKGFFSALLLSLWAGGGYSISPRSILQAYEDSPGRSGKGSPAGFCRTGLNRGYPLFCPKLLREADGKCNLKNRNVHLLSVDECSSAVDTLRALILRPTERTPGVDARTRDVWSAQAARFSAKGSVNGGGGSPRALTLEDFATQHGFPKTIDVLRISAGKNWYAILRNAGDFIESRKIGLVTFDVSESIVANENVALWNALEKHQYDCYLPYYVGFIKLTGGCWPRVDLLKEGKVFCASRIHAPGIVLVYDSLMLGHQDGYYWPH